MNNYSFSEIALAWKKQMMSNNYSYNESGKVGICRSGVQLESEFGMGPVFVLSADRVFIRGYDILQEGE